MKWLRFIQAYTMIEIMISISIIGIVSSLVLPVFSDAQESARSLSCMNNLRTVGFGSEQYCQEYIRMPANVIINTMESRITNRNFAPSYFLSYQGRPTGAGVMISTRHIPMEVMYCPNAEEKTPVSIADDLSFRVERIKLKALFSDTSLTSYVKGGQNMPVPDARGGEFNIGINPRFGHNQKKPVFTELMVNHKNGMNSLFGDNHVDFFELKMRSEWIEGDPRIFESLLNKRGIEITDIPEERMLDYNDYLGEINSRNIENIPRN